MGEEEVAWVVNQQFCFINFVILLIYYFTHHHQENVSIIQALTDGGGGDPGLIFLLNSKEDCHFCLGLPSRATIVPELIRGKKISSFYILLFLVCC